MELANQLSNEFTAIKMNIEGAVEFKSIVQTDARGEFVRHYSASMLAEFESVRIVNANISRTKKRLTFRGMHFRYHRLQNQNLFRVYLGGFSIY